MLYLCSPVRPSDPGAASAMPALDLAGLWSDRDGGKYNGCVSTLSVPCLTQPTSALSRVDQCGEFGQRVGGHGISTSALLGHRDRSAAGA